MQKNGTRMLLIALLAIVGWFAFRFRSQKLAGTPQNLDLSEKISVVASFYPVGYFAERVAGNLADIHVLVTAGLEPHDYEPTPQDIALINQSHLFMYNGAGFEPWANAIVESLNPDQVINTSANLQLREQDPHIWLDPVLAQAQVQKILQGFIHADPSHTIAYQQNAAALTQELHQLDQEFQAGLAQCSTRTIVTSHNAFGYLAARYNVQVQSLSGLSPDEEPSAQKLAELTDFVRQNAVTTIFLESMASPKLAQTLASETGAQVAVFHPLEGVTDEELQRGENYLTIQRKNLANLRNALECK